MFDPIYETARKLIADYYNDLDPEKKHELFPILTSKTFIREVEKYLVKDLTTYRKEINECTCSQ